jgi:hypothetical protein
MGYVNLPFAFLYRWVEERSDVIKLRRGRYACTNNNIFIIYMALRATPLHVGDFKFQE